MEFVVVIVFIALCVYLLSPEGINLVSVFILLAISDVIAIVFCVRYLNFSLSESYYIAFFLGLMIFTLIVAYFYFFRFVHDHLKQRH